MRCNVSLDGSRCSGQLGKKVVVLGNWPSSRHGWPRPQSPRLLGPAQQCEYCSKKILPTARPHLACLSPPFEHPCFRLAARSRGPSPTSSSGVMITLPSAHTASEAKKTTTPPQSRESALLPYDATVGSDDCLIFSPGRVCAAGERGKILPCLAIYPIVPNMSPFPVATMVVNLWMSAHYGNPLRGIGQSTVDASTAQHCSNATFMSIELPTSTITLLLYVSVALSRACHHPPIWTSTHTITAPPENEASSSCHSCHRQGRSTMLLITAAATYILHSSALPPTPLLLT